LARTSKRIALLLPLVIGGCRCNLPREPTHLLADFSDIAGLAAVELHVDLPSQTDTESSVRAIAERVQRGVESGTGAIEQLNRVVFEDLEFEREIDSHDPRFLLLPTVVAEARGTCVGLTQIYLTVAEQLDLDLRAVLAPGHVFVRHGDRNIELLRRGEAMPNDWYRQRYRVPATVRAYMRPLSPEETVAVLHFNIGNALRRKRDLKAALAHYNDAVVRFPDWPEAHANRGLTLQLSGDLDAAARAYERARELYPELPGLSENLEALAKERRADP
jgi:regulator of sirC expression with transglutaminase-like and TPR domain